MDELMRYLAMGGYAAYVWPAFATAAVVLAVLLVISLRTLRALEAVLADLQRRAESEPRRRRRPAPAREQPVAAHEEGAR